MDLGRTPERVDTSDAVQALSQELLRRMPFRLDCVMLDGTKVSPSDECITPLRTDDLLFYVRVQPGLPAKQSGGHDAEALLSDDVAELRQ